MSKVAIVGAGLIGRAWGAVFARSGFEVALYDPAPGATDLARANIAQSLEEQQSLGLVDDATSAVARVRIATDLADAVRGAAFVQENGPETPEGKKALFGELDRLAAPDTILASSTSFIPCSVFSADLAGRARCLVGHPVNPPHLVPIVEIAPAPWTDPVAVETARSLYERAGQVPIVLRREVQGFVLNRLQAALLAEAFRIVGAGICSPEDVDKTIRDGLGYRWSFMGPFETIELNAPGGIADYATRYGASLDRMTKDILVEDAFGAGTIATIMSQWPGAQTKERIAELSNWRDQRLAALKAHKAKMPGKPDV